ncbi:ABC transporter permease [Nocardioides korecus]
MSESSAGPVAATRTPTSGEQGTPVRGSTTRWRDRINAEAAIVLFAIPVIVVVGFGAFAIWHATATLDSVEETSLAWSEVLSQIWGHVKLTFVSAFFVILIAIPLGVLLTRGRARAAAPIVVGIANAGQAAPSVGLIVLFAMWLQPGFSTAVIALTLYAILPVLRNTIVGLQGVDRTLVEAGRGVGMSVVAVLLRIELPLALPVIMAGVRTALVLLVGTATLATFINGGGLGATLQAGISLLRYSVIVWGAVLVALLALLIEWLGRVLELVARPKGV